MKKYNKILFLLAGLGFILAAIITLNTSFTGNLGVTIIFVVVAALQFAAAYMQKK